MDVVKASSSSLTHALSLPSQLSGRLVFGLFTLSMYRGYMYNKGSIKIELFKYSLFRMIGQIECHICWINRSLPYKVAIVKDFLRQVLCLELCRKIYYSTLSIKWVFSVYSNYGIANCLPLIIMVVFLFLVARKDIVVIISRKVMDLSCVRVAKDLILFLKGKSMLFWNGTIHGR